jgi:small subunit ribosomal protein S15
LVPHSEYCGIHRRVSRSGAYPLRKVEIMPLLKEQKSAIIERFGKDAQDTGSARVQVALLSARIVELTEHLKVHKKDHATRRGLFGLLGQRRNLLQYIKRNDVAEYRALIADLGIRDNIN